MDDVELFKEFMEFLRQRRESEDPTRNCPCRPENGGSGVCGCTLGGPKITC